MFRGKRKFIFIGLLAIVLVVVGFLVYMFLGFGGPDFISVSELKAQGEVASEQHVNVKGRVVVGSIKWNAADRVLQFVLADDQESIIVKYGDVAPGGFEPGAPLMVIGKYKDGVIEARAMSNKKSGLCSACHT